MRARHPPVLLSVAIIAALCASAPAQYIPEADLVKLTAALKGDDPAAWSAAAKRLADLDPDPLGNGMPQHHDSSRGFNRRWGDLRSALHNHLTSEDPKRRAEAVEALAGLAPMAAGVTVNYWDTVAAKGVKRKRPPPSMVHLADDPEPRVRAALLRVWRHYNESHAAPVAARLLADGDPRVRAQAILALVRFSAGDDAVDGICRRIHDDDNQVRVTALRAAVSFRAERAAERIIECLDARDPAVRHGAVMACGWLELGDAADRLHELLDDQNEGTRYWTSVYSGGGWRTIDHLSGTETIAGGAMWALGRLGDSRIVSRLLRELAREAEGKWQHQRMFSRRVYPKGWYARIAAYALGEIGDPRTLGALALAAERTDTGWAARKAISKMNVSPHGPSIGNRFTSPEGVRDLRRQADNGDICRYPRQTIPRLYEAVNSDEFLFQVLSPNPDYDDAHPLSLVADFPAVRAGALQCLGRIVDSPRLRKRLHELAARDDPTLAWGGVYVLARATDLAKRPVPETGDARLFAGLALAELRLPGAETVLREYLDARSPRWQLLVASALTRLNDPDGVRKLAALTESKQDDLPSQYVSGAAAYALTQYGGITLKLEPACRVTGRVVCSVWQGRGVKVGNVHVSVERGSRSVLSHRAEDHEFEFFLPAGKYRLEASGDDLLPATVGFDIRPGLQKLKLRPIDLEPNALGGLFGKPAPELDHIMAWRDGGPFKLSGLRGRHVLLHFCDWKRGGIDDVLRLMEICDAFDERDLKVIIVHNYLPSIAAIDTMLEAIEGRYGRVPPCTIALDEKRGLGPEEEAGKAPVGATAFEYGAFDRYSSDRTLLIGPAGNLVKRYSLFYSQEIKAELEQLLGVTRRTPAWETRMNAAYGLAEGEVFKRIALPFIPDRRVFQAQWRARQDGVMFGGSDYSPHHGRRETMYMACGWDGRLRWGGSGCSSYSLADLIGVRRIDLKGTLELLRSRLPGDWVIRTGVSLKERHRALEKYLREEFDLNIRIDSRLVEREVIVARGRYQLTPLPGMRHPNFINIYSADTPTQPRGPYLDIRRGTLGDFLLSKKVVGLGLSGSIVPVIDETESSDVEVQWLYGRDGNREDLRKDPTALDKYLERIARQTSLSFRKERRQVRTWFVVRRE